MSTRSGHHQVTTIIGVGIICMTIISFIYFARSNTGQLDFETQLNYHELQTTHSGLTKQYEALYEYKERLEKAYLTLKNEKASLVESTRNEKVEFTELKELYSKQVQTLQDDLKTCHDQLHSFVLSSKNANSVAAAADAAAGGGGSSSSGAGDIGGLGSNNELDKTHDVVGAGAVGGLQLPNLSAPSQSSVNQDSAALPQPEFNNRRFDLNNKRHKPVSSSFSGGDAGIYKATPSGGNSIRIAVDNHIVSNVLKEPIQSPIAQVPMEPAQPSSDPNQDLVGNVLI